jgi:hypothetical protein
VPFNATPQEIRQRLLMYQHHGKPVFDVSDPASARVLEDESNTDLTDLAPAFRARTDLFIITDDNMVPEYKDTRTYQPERSWAAFFERRRTGKGPPGAHGSVSPVPANQ